MPNKPGKRRFGSIRQLPSGRFQIRYPGPDGKIRLGENTYARERDAEKALSLIEAKLITGNWTDPQRSKVKLGDYADKWIAERTNLRPRTVEIYKGLLKRYIRRTWAAFPSANSTQPRSASGASSCSATASAHPRSPRRTGSYGRCS
ncbi:hypothetical protein ACIBG4_05695 [Nonomuraea sp. NPDC050383]|uniref:hypothetical protein n=1 Tax=Nonomuraea sp. NPDC050383 TaxID=3364362 RepID=UPI0037AF8F23